MSSFKCAMCGGEFETGWSDEEASAEFNQYFPEHDIKNADTVCDDCFNKIHPAEHPIEVELAKRDKPM